MYRATNVQYDLADRVRALETGGIGAIHRLATQTGLVEAIDRRVRVLRLHLPYHESDHVLGLAYNALCGGTCLQDIELRRQNEVYLDALGAQRIPDPTTAGDCGVRERDGQGQVSSMPREPVRVIPDGLLAGRGESLHGLLGRRNNGKSRSLEWFSSRILHFPILDPLFRPDQQPVRDFHHGLLDRLKKSARCRRPNEPTSCWDPSISSS